MSDSVHSPAHYNQGDIEAIDAIEAQLTPEEFQGYLKGNIAKYMWRSKHKNGMEDIYKASWHMARLTINMTKSTDE